MRLETRSGDGTVVGADRVGVAGKFVAVAVLAACGVGAVATVALAQTGGQSTEQAAGAASTQSVAARKFDAVQPGQETFPSAAEATKALVAAVKSDDQAALMKALGPNAKDILWSGDPTEDKNDREEFVTRYQEMHRMVMEPDGTTTLYIGAENYPTPIPLVQNKEGAWYFDTAAGREEILFRRVGENELAVIQVCHELVDAEKEYYAKPHDGDSVQQYAQKFISDPGKHNGLYWATASGETDSPIGPLVATAETEGYSKNASEHPQPFHGYYFRMLKGQGAVPGKAEHSYTVDGKMTAGFAIIAYPAEYRSSGVMTFIVDDGGVVYEKDFGHRTDELAKAMKHYDRDASWHKAD